MSGTTPTLLVENLHVEFDLYGGTTKVLDGVNLSVLPNQRIGVVGETGCGKSLTMLTSLGMLRCPPARIVQGKILYRGADVLRMSPGELRRLRGNNLSMVFQDPMTSLNPVFTIRQQMSFVLKAGKRVRGRSNRRDLESRMIGALRQLNLPDPDRVLGSYPLQLSGGMRQRILIAMAIINEPTLLIADEISTALDVTVQAQVLRQLEDLVKQRGMSMALISHNLGIIKQMCDFVYVMYAGQVVERAPTDELFHCPVHPYTRALISALPRLTGEEMSKGIPGRIPDYSDPPAGCRYHPRCPMKTEQCIEPPPTQEAGGTHTFACVHDSAVLLSKNAEGVESIG